MHGTTEVELPPEPVESTDRLRAALEGGVADRAAVGAALSALVAAQPTYLDGWARLAEWALDAGDPVTAYAYARVGYHRGLDRIRRNGWKGSGPVPWRHEPNQGFLRSVHGLLRAAAAIGEDDEAQRCRDFLLELDPADALGVSTLDLGALRG